ncbi:antibiotic biosynthesis monooxygenase [Ensifer sp. T173]|uniref:Antibiotic biosynthesis monooxygenase n=1 Tax=Ensifer canadensis TaxID=555315 RepID=A0AAW4FJ18_9HYPH|nr:antibiotic biosynthesis monooxygenase [Ensifer sp. ENS11]MBM3092102.1 antibiotic biosynthesis monooxygenase [Ensifer canadensis]UBI77502.1 antibiotic biosynthesis monooxygenase [Ensifer canadensis]
MKTCGNSKCYSDLCASNKTRGAVGCLDLSISEDSVDPSRVNMMELWESEAALRAWRKIAKPPKTDVKFDAGNVRKHEISHSGPPF